MTLRGHFHTLVVVALGITWILDGLQVTLADLMPRAALDAAAALVATLLAWRRAAL